MVFISYQKVRKTPGLIRQKTTQFASIKKAEEYTESYKRRNGDLFLWFLSHAEEAKIS